MENIHTVEYNGRSVGHVLLHPMGLYLRLVCECNLQREGRYTLLCEWESGYIRLGLLTPSDGVYTYSATVPKKRIDASDLHFRLQHFCSESLVTGCGIADLGILVSARLHMDGSNYILEGV